QLRIQETQTVPPRIATLSVKPRQQSRKPNLFALVQKLVATIPALAAAAKSTSSVAVKTADCPTNPIPLTASASETSRGRIWRNRWKRNSSPQHVPRIGKCLLPMTRDSPRLGTYI